MAPTTHVYTTAGVARLIGENIELLDEIASSPDNIDHREMIHVHDGTESGTVAFTERGIECLQELLADVRTWEGGARKFLLDAHCDPEIVERVTADEPKS